MALFGANIAILSVIGRCRRRFYRVRHGQNHEFFIEISALSIIVLEIFLAAISLIPVFGRHQNYCL